MNRYKLILNYLSYLFGLLVHIRFPKVINNFVINSYISLFKVNREEFEGNISDYKSLGKFFVRNLKKGERPLESDFVSPVDAEIRNVDNINDDTLVQVKNKTYSLEKFTDSKTAVIDYKGGTFFNFYLSPKDYHHIHLPFNAKINSVKYIPGALWPVNNLSLDLVPELFCVNERVVIDGLSEFGKFSLILIGAYNVGKISLEFMDLLTNIDFSNRDIQEYSILKDLSIGEKIGTFHMGSSVVLVVDKQTSDKYNFISPKQIKYGNTLIS